MGSHPQEKVKERGHRSHKGLEKLWHYRQLGRDSDRRAERGTIIQLGLRNLQGCSSEDAGMGSGREGRKGWESPAGSKRMAGLQLQWGQARGPVVAFKTMDGGTSTSESTRGVPDTQWSLPQTQGSVDTGQKGKLT